MMNKSGTELKTSGVFLSVTVIPLILQNIHSYIDPGTGSLILQVAISSFIGGLFIIKVFWKRVSAFLRNLFFKN